MAETYNYLYEYERDIWAEKRFETEIKFDWSRVSKVREIEIDFKWEESENAKRFEKIGKPRMRVLVECPNPKHGMYHKIMCKTPLPRDCYCYKCITDEINRIINLRAIRGFEASKKEKEK